MSFLARFSKIAALATAALVAACGGGGGGGGGSTGGGPIVDAGILKVAMTDAPACGYEKVNVTVQKVRVHQSSTAAAGDPGWSEVVLVPPQRVDLLTLMNGVVVELGQVTLPVGKYRQLSVVLAANDATSPLANSVTPLAQTERALGAPASLQGGLTIPVDIDIVKDQITDVVVDFDACNSVLRLGATGNYDLSPRLSVVRRLSATGQRITGWVSTTLDPSTTRISAQSAGAVVRATSPDSTGRFVLYPLPAGTYDVVISGLGRVPAVITGVPASDTASTDLNTAATAINPPASTTHTAQGTVNTGATPVDARVTIVKKYTGGPNVVIAGAPVDANTGNLAYTLSTGAAVRAPFVANNGALNFSADPAAPTGLYTIVVTSGGVSKSADVDVTTGDPGPASFTFP
jgi:hypothetical protein